MNGQLGLHNEYTEMDDAVRKKMDLGFGYLDWLGKEIWRYIGMAV